MLPTYSRQTLQAVALHAEKVDVEVEGRWHGDSGEESSAGGEMGGEEVVISCLSSLLIPRVALSVPYASTFFGRPYTLSFRPKVRHPLPRV